MANEVATLGGGCFWCLEAVYQEMAGVITVISGYMGGHTDSPTYEEVCSSKTGHAEVVQIVFDPSVTSYRQILDVFFTIHDPTTLNRQGNDVGTQYRSIIFFHSPEQEKIAREVIQELTSSNVFADPIVTEIQPASQFYLAESYHQNYFRENPFRPYCMFAIAPKVRKFRSRFPEKKKLVKQGT